MVQPAIQELPRQESPEESAEKEIFGFKLTIADRFRSLKINAEKLNQTYSFLGPTDKRILNNGVLTLGLAKTQEGLRLRGVYEIAGPLEGRIVAAKPKQINFFIPVDNPTSGTFTFGEAMALVSKLDAKSKYEPLPAPLALPLFRDINSVVSR